MGQNTENLQMNIKGKMYIRKISLNIGNPTEFMFISLKKKNKFVLAAGNMIVG